MAKKAISTTRNDLVGQAAVAAKSIANMVQGKRRNSEGLTIHVHVGDLFLIGFDEAIDAEEWGAREVNNDGSGLAKAARAKRDAEPERKTKRRLSLRKGNVLLTADEEAEPAGRAAKTRRKVSTKVSAKKRSRR